MTTTTLHTPPAATLILAVLAAFAAGCGSGPTTPVAPTAPTGIAVMPPADPGAASGGTPPATSQPPATSTPSPAPASARYRVTFEALWSAATHPRDFPADAHFSRLVGGTHAAATRFWQEGALASDGIRDMAERGRTTPLDNEVRSAIAAGTAEHLIIGGDIPRSPGSVSLEFEISQAHPLVTLVSMVAPSPDWFTGVSGLPLFEQGQWVDRRSLELFPWDAGTDSGPTFASPDQATTPRRPVARITGFPFEQGGQVAPVGRFSFERIR